MRVDNPDNFINVQAKLSEAATIRATEISIQGLHRLPEGPGSSEKPCLILFCERLAQIGFS